MPYALKTAQASTTTAKGKCEGDMGAERSDLLHTPPSTASRSLAMWLEARSTAIRTRTHLPWLTTSTALVWSLDKIGSRIRWLTMTRNNTIASHSGFDPTRFTIRKRSAQLRYVQQETEFSVKCVLVCAKFEEMVRPVGFEPTQISLCELESHALNRSAKDAIVFFQTAVHAICSIDFPPSLRGACVM